MPDFSKIWATDSPLTPYTFTDSEYLEGWDFVAAAPPTKNQFDAWFKQTDEKLKWLYDKLNDTANAIYPVGAVYISFVSTSPASLFGGTWQRLKDTFLLANGDSYAANTTGGSPTKTITVNNLPAHNHTVNSAGAHTHTATTANNGSHNHTASAASSGAHTHTATTAKDGAHTHTINSAGNHYHGAMGEKTTLPSLYGFYNNSNNHQGAQGDSDNAIWKTSTDGAHTHTMKSAGEHDHNVTVNSNGAHTHSITVNSNGSHNHSVTVNSNGAHTHTTNNTGGSQPLNILPPYTTVYMWKRTA